MVEGALPLHVSPRGDPSPGSAATAAVDLFAEYQSAERATIIKALSKRACIHFIRVPSKYIEWCHARWQKAHSTELILRKAAKHLTSIDGVRKVRSTCSERYRCEAQTVVAMRG